MNIVVIAWLYVTLMMAVAEATNTTGTVLGAFFTFLLYGLLPVALVIYLMRTPVRRRAIRERELAAQEAARGAAALKARSDPPADPSADMLPASGSAKPHAGSEAPADAVAAVRKET